MVLAVQDWLQEVMLFETGPQLYKAAEVLYAVTPDLLG
jgi:hypothetical protein